MTGLRSRNSAFSRSAAALPLFVALFLFITHVVGNVLPDAALRFAIDGTGALVILFLKAFGLQALYINGYLSVAGFPMEITLECTALHYLALFAAAVLLYPGCSIRSRIAGLLGGFLAVLLLNVARIGTIGIIGVHSPALFEFIHTYVWQGAFAVAVLGIWMIWVHGPSVLDKRSLYSASVFFLVSLAVVIILGLLVDGYAAMTAALSRGMLFLAPWSDRITAVAAGPAVLFTSGGVQRLYPVQPELLSLAPFIALLVSTWPPRRRFLLARRLGAGIVLLIAVNVLIGMLAGCAAFFLVPESLDKLIWLIRGVNIAAPILLWWVMRYRIDREHPAERAVP